MIFSNKIANYIHIGAILIVIIVCVFLAVDVNKRFPQAEIVSNRNNEECVEWLGCSIKALEYGVYTIGEYKKAHPEDMNYAMADESKEGTGVVWFRTEVTNKNDYEVKFSLTRQSVAAAFPSAWNNGVQPLSGHGVLSPGETRVMEGIAYYGPTLYHFTEAEHFPDNEFQLIFSFYPERVILHFGQELRKDKMEASL